MFAHLDAHASTGLGLGVLCGVSSLLVWEGGPRLTDVVSMPPEFRPEADLGIHKLETLQRPPRRPGLVSGGPAAEFRRLGAERSP
ncbi:MAG TPA: hypothetical protein VLR88_10290 [Propionibacteriaceae bacterium]|nr:hypothetical protein [Propionibacteriaceae bacterium]